MGQSLAQKNNTGLVIFYLAAFLVLTWLCYIFPYTGDDWAWGSSIGLDRLKIWFDNYNGRYAGNLTVLFLTRYKFVKALVEAICLLAIVFLIVPPGKNRWFNTITGLCLLTAMPKLLLRQSIVWTAGFSNYVISIALVLVYLRYCYRLPAEPGRGEPRCSGVLAVPFCLLAFVSALFAEHVTVYMVGAALAIVLYTLYQYRRVYAAHIGYLAGAALGAAYMFSNRAYRTIASGQDTYRTMGDGGILSRMLDNYSAVIAKELFLNNFVLNICIFLAVLLLLRRRRGTFGSIAIKRWAWAGAAAVCVACLYSIAINILRIFFRTEPGVAWLNGGITVLFAAGLAVVAFTGGSGALKVRLLFLAGSVALLTGPLLAVTPIGSRCFFPSYVMLCFFAMECFGQITISRRFCAAAALGLILALANLFRIYLPIQETDAARLSHIRGEVAKGSAKVEISHFPREKYLWCATPKTGSIWEERYKLYYGIPLEVTLIDVPFKAE